MRTLGSLLLVAWLALVAGVAEAIETPIDAKAGAQIANESRPGRAIELPFGLGEPIGVAINAYDGSAWFVTDASLLVHVGRDGTLIQGSTLATPASVVAVDLDETVWVVVGASLLHFSPRGDALGTRSLPMLEGERATSIVIDALRNRGWVGTSRALYRVDDAAQAMLEGDIASLALDPRSGHVVAVADGALLSVIESEIRALAGLSVVDFELPLEVTYDGSEGAFVVETTQRTWWIDASDIVLKDAASASVAHVTAPFRIDPALDLLRPPDGGVMTKATSEIVARVRALCNGAPCEVPAYRERVHVDAILDGVRLPQSHVDIDGIVRWPMRDVPDGTSEFTARVTDRFGHHATVHARWTAVTATGIETSRAESPSALPATTAPTSTKAANKPPTVALTSPAAGAVFTVGNAVALAAAAADPDGSIAKVEFYRSGTLLIGTSSSAPFTAIWSAPTAGTHSLTAKAYDNRNGTSTSSPVTISVVANQPPSISMTAPAAGAFVRLGDSITLSATATDSDGRVTSVEFFDDAVSLGSVSTAPFQRSWMPLTAGLHVLHARATDDNGAATDSQSVQVTVGSPPIVIVTSPVACSFVDGPADVILRGDAMSASGRIVRVDYFDNGVLVASASSPPWQVLLSRAQVGTHSISAQAVDDRGLSSTSRPAPLTIRAPNQPPTIALTAPANGTRVGVGSRVELAATASDPDGTITAVEFRMDYAFGPLIARAISPPYTAQWTPASPGTYSLVGIAIDDRGTWTSSSPASVVVVANALPNVAVTSPAASAQFVAPATISVTANASDSDGSISKVDFFAGATLIGTSTSSPYAVTWSNVAAGSYSLTARATDNAGGVTTSAAVPITVASNAAPTVSLTIASSGPYFAPATLSLAADAIDSDGTIARVEFYANGALIGTGSTAPYGLVWDAVQGGSYALTAKAVDDGGASTSTAPAAVSVQAAPVLSFDSALGTAIIDDDTVLVSGYVSAPTNAAVTVNGVVTHLDDRGFFQANDVPLSPGSNEIVAVVTTQDGQAVTKSVTVQSSGPGLFKVQAAPTEGIETLQVRFSLENPENVPFKQAFLDLDGDGYPNLIVDPSQFRDGKLAVLATYPVGTWLATVTFYDEQDRVIYRTHKSIVVLLPELFQGNVRAIYENMLLRLRAGNIAGALTAFTGSAQERFNDIFTQLQPDLATIIDQLGTITEITFNLDMAELTLVRTGVDGSQKFMIYLIRSEDGIWRIDGM
jgi:hypothetical protein